MNLSTAGDEGEKEVDEEEGVPSTPRSTQTPSTSSSLVETSEKPRRVDALVIRLEPGFDMFLYEKKKKGFGMRNKKGRFKS